MAFSLVLLGLLVGCAGGIGSMPVSEVAKLSNSELCYLNSMSPVGFIPLEVDRRRKDAAILLDCSALEQEILAYLAKSEEASNGGQANVPLDMLRREDCKGVTLGRVVNPRVIEKGSARIYDHRHHQYVRNNTNAEKFVLFSVSGLFPSKFIKVPPRSEQLVLFGSYIADILSGKREPLNVEINSCRSVE